MKKILILYFSGAGATKRVAELIHAKLSQNCLVDIFSVENDDKFNMNEYNAFILGTPVYHAAPCRPIMRFIDKMKPFDNEKPAFIYNTRTLCSCNTNRILARKLKEKNILTIMDRAYQSPASDGTLITPFIKKFFEFEKKLDQKIIRDCTAFLAQIQKDNLQGYIPNFRLSSIINAPNKLGGQLTTLPIYLHKDKCIKCEKCIKECPHNAREKDISGYPAFISNKCENCYRCIHHCPNLALSLSKRKTPKKVLKY